MKNTTYYGITYPLPKFLQQDWFYDLWKKHICSRGYHLFDECLGGEHFLYCDACSLTIPITIVKKWNYVTNKDERI